MPTVVLQDAAGVDLGFLLVAGGEPLSDGPANRDVVLMKLPLPSESPLAGFLDCHRHVEFPANVQSTTTGTVLTFAVEPEVSVRVELGTTGIGSWSAGAAGTGSCRLAPAIAK